MAAVMHMDRTAFRRLDKSQWQAEDRMRDWGRIVRRDRAPCDWRNRDVTYDAMRAADPWLEQARQDAWFEPAWFGPFNAELRAALEGVRMTFLRRRYADGLTTDQARRGLGMSKRAAHAALAAARKIADASLGA